MMSILYENIRYNVDGDGKGSVTLVGGFFEKTRRNVEEKWWALFVILMWNSTCWKYVYWLSSMGFKIRSHDFNVLIEF